MAPNLQRVLSGFQFKPTPVVIDPYDKIVQKAYNSLSPSMQKNIDVIKLEPTCPGNKAAWVSNQDLLTGKSGKERVIHLCLNKIKEEFKKTYGSPFTLKDPSRQNQMEEVVVAYLRDVILPHEETHIRQEIKGEGDFGHSPELEAERAESYKELEQFGIRKKAYNKRSLAVRTIISSKIDSIASELEAKGLIKEAEALDMISNTIEAMQSAKVDEALDVIGDATPEEIQKAMQMLKGGRVASEEKESADIRKVMMALALLGGLMGASAGDPYEGVDWNDPKSKIPGVEEERMEQQRMTAERLKAKAEAKARSQKEGQKMQAVLDMLKTQRKKPGQTVFHLEKDKEIETPQGKPWGKYESPTLQRGKQELKRLEPYTSPQLGGQG